MLPHLVFCQSFTWKFEVSWHSKCIHGQPKIECNIPWAMQLLWLCLCPKMASEALSKHLISKHFLGEHAPRFPTLACLCRHTYKSDIHVTPLLNILAAGLLCTQLKHYITYSTSPNFLCVRRVRYRSIPVIKVVVGLRVTISSLPKQTCVKCLFVWLSFPC